MRNLTIKRTKSFVACLAKMKVYIEDSASGEITINGVSCRKLGELKNGEEKTFLIEDYGAKVFVIADKLSKNYCNDYYELPAGPENITLSGKNKFNPASGNAFRFDNNNNQQVIANRKKGSRKGLIILLIAVVIGGIGGGFIGDSFADDIISDTDSISDTQHKEKVFASKGMSITLTDDFNETEIENYTLAFTSREVAVFALKEEFSLAEGFGDYTLEEYGSLVIENNGFNDVVLNTVNGLTFFEYEYENPQNLATYCYASFIFKADDAFWLVQFATLKEDYESYASQIVEWAESVSFFTY